MALNSAQIQDISTKGAQFTLGLLQQDTSLDIKAAADIARQASDAAVAQVDSSNPPSPVDLVLDALQIADDALTAAGKTTLAPYDEEAIQLVENFSNNGGHPIAAAIKTFFQNIFKKKQAAPAA